MLVAEQPLRGQHPGVLAQVLAVHDQVLPVHVDLHVVEPLRAQRVDHVQRHPDVPHEDLHRGLGVLVLEEDRHAALLRALRRLPDPVDEPRPRVGVRRLERVVVALDPGPDDEVRLDLGREVDALQRAADRLVANLVGRRREPALAEHRVEVHPARHAVDVVLAERRAHRVEVRRVELLRVVELVAVDQVAETLDRPPDLVRGRLAGPLRLVARRHEPCRHRPECPDPQTRLHLTPLEEFGRPRGRRASAGSRRRPRRPGSRPRMSPPPGRARARPRSHRAGAGTRT